MRCALWGALTAGESYYEGVPGSDWLSDCHMTRLLASDWLSDCHMTRLLASDWLEYGTVVQN